MSRITINNRVFTTVNNIEYIFNRDNINNQSDINGSAALAIHKAIIGVCGLSSLENAELKLGISMRSSKAVQAYYVIYHLFTCCMLLDNSYEIKFCPRYREMQYGTDLRELQETPQSPEDWNDRKYLEMDLAVKISHSDIKKYCNKLRRRREYYHNHFPRFLDVLYDAFIREDCNVILFEKADYIRDRAIYRPTHVASQTETPIQTSKNVRDQIDSLPTSDLLYDTICAVLKAIWAVPDETFWRFRTAFILEIVDCPTDYAESLGYTWEKLEQVGGSKSNTSVPSYICQLMELYEPDEVISFYKQYWTPVLNDAKKRWFPTHS